VAADRLAAAQQAAKAGAQILILDDGFHNPHLQTTISILVYDAQQGFGNGALLPAGPLRAPIAETLARATLVVSLGGPFPLPSPVPVLQARLVLKLPPILKAQRAIAFAGLGFPEKFFRTLQDAGVSLVQTFSFPDHHFYKEKELCFLKNEACRHHACLITTRKDFVRLSEKERVGILSADISLIWQYPEKLDAYFDTL
jgi:tetraacyldisaccharide 4'-kinase